LLALHSPPTPFTRRRILPNSGWSEIPSRYFESAPAPRQVGEPLGLSVSDVPAFKASASQPSHCVAILWWPHVSGWWRLHPGYLEVDRDVPVTLGNCTRISHEGRNGPLSKRVAVIFARQTITEDRFGEERDINEDHNH
jgi:hypothetical protein